MFCSALCNFLSSYFFFSRMHVSYFVCVCKFNKKTVTKKKKKMIGAKPGLITMTHDSPDVLF